MNIGRPKKIAKCVRFSISLDPVTGYQLHELCNLTGFKRSRIVAMAILHFYNSIKDEK